MVATTSDKCRPGERVTFLIKPSRMDQWTIIKNFIEEGYPDVDLTNAQVLYVMMNFFQEHGMGKKTP